MDYLTQVATYSSGIDFSPELTKILPFEEVERQTLAHALKVMDNNVTQSAQTLKMPRLTLYRKLKLYQLIASDQAPESPA